MRISRYLSSQSAGRQNGTAMIVVLALLAFILIYILANARTLHTLGRELRLLDQRQTQRLRSSTHARSSATSQAKP
jgi:hypothetical protein